MRAELERRASLTEAVRDLFLSRPGVWIPVRVLADVGGFAAWRTRVSDARHLIEADDCGTIRWNGQVKDSAYRYEPRAIEAERPAQQVSLFGEMR